VFVCLDVGVIGSSRLKDWGIHAGTRLLLENFFKSERSREITLSRSGWLGPGSYDLGWEESGSLVGHALEVTLSRCDAEMKVWN
jgi:hypothetical protein